jgi:16S rRNA (cytosine967-C5)-methyltransferase
MTAIARTAAFTALRDVTERRKYTNLALQHVLQQHTLSPRDRALCTEIVYGTVQRQRSLDALIQPLLSRPLEDLDTAVLTILRMTVYQLAFLDKVPPYAAIHDAVELTKQSSRKATGFVNGVLRNFARDKRPARERLAQLADRCATWADKMGLLHSYPTWLIASWESAFGRERAVALAEACNQPSGFSARVNLLRTSREDVLAELRHEYGDVAEPSRLAASGIRFYSGLDIHKWSALQDGRVTIQDEGAMLVAPLLNPQPGQRILDMCAGLGTKTTHIAELQGDEGVVEACDIHPHKLQHLRAAAQRMGLQSIRVTLADARSLPDRPGAEERYDAVLLDAPCSGFGVLRHRPDIRWKRTQDDVRSLTQLQRELLQSAARLVKPGGVVVYCTCTMMPEENEELVESVLADPTTGLTWADWNGVVEEDMAVRAEAGRGLLLTPELFGTDGFYMARLRKKLS